MCKEPFVGGALLGRKVTANGKLQVANGKLPRTSRGEGDAVSGALKFGVKKDFFADQNPGKSTVVQAQRVSVLLQA